MAEQADAKATTNASSEAPKVETQETQASQDAAAANTATAKLFEGKEANAKETAGEQGEKQETKEVKKSAPEKYSFEEIEESPLDKTFLDRIVSDVEKTAKKQGLSNVEANKLLKSEHQKFASFVAAQQEHLKQRTSAWAEELRNDKTFGGENFNRNSELAHRVIKTFGSEALIKQLKETGLGNHPELVRLMYRVGSAMSEDQFVGGAKSGGKPRTAEEILYGSSN